jgi:hypothetical protein
MWCIPKVDAEYVACMEDVLDLYNEKPDRKRPVVCFDESPTQLIGEVREPIPAKPGQLERFDCEYRRNGTANLFVFLDVHNPWRKVKVTSRRAAADFAVCMRYNKINGCESWSPALISLGFPQFRREQTGTFGKSVGRVMIGRDFTSMRSPSSAPARRRS